MTFVVVVFLADSIKQLSLPVTEEPEEAPILCNSVTGKCPQYIAGDGRVNEHLGLTTMHTLWAREHNRIAKSLQAPECDSTTIFNTARHIVTAQIQNIMYNDYLRRIFGDEFHQEAGLHKYKGYHKYVKSNIPNSFASAAFRYGHSQVQPTFELRRHIDAPPFAEVRLGDAFFNISVYQEYGTDPILRGFMRQNARKIDEFITETLTAHLFADNGDSPGMDLASLNIMRGRDHGIPPYVIWRNWAQRVCHEDGNNKPKFRNPDTELLLMEYYGSLDTVDLFVGGLAEEPLPGGLIGPTFGCILANTFVAVRDGDRFFFENIFNKKQINEIKRVNLAHVICENTENTFGKVNKDPFVAESDTVECEELKKETLNLDLWDCEQFSPYDIITNEKKEENILSVLKGIVEKLEAQEARTGPNTNEEADKDSAFIMTDDELAEKLESLLNKVKK